MDLDRRELLLSTASLSLLTLAPVASQAAAVADPKLRIRRRYVQVDDGSVFFLTAGKGPPLVLLHSCPGDSASFLRDIPELATRYTVFAFDVPGFGRSDPMPVERRDVSFMADRVAGAMRALNLRPALIFGTHTGAALGTEIASRQPDLVQGLMTDGNAIFNQQEVDTWFDDFVPPLIPDKMGGHFSSIWTRCRDQGIRFPWSYYKPDHFLASPKVLPPEGIQKTAMIIMRCGRTYSKAFRTVFSYGQRGVVALGKMDQPTLIGCTAGDVLVEHLKRLPKLKPNQTVEEFPTNAAMKAARDQWLASISGGMRPASAPPEKVPTTAGISPYFVDLPDDRDVFVRVAGEPGKPAIVLIHDAPGSSAMHQPLILALAAHARVYAIDLPGCGETDPLPMDAPTTAQFAETVSAVMGKLGLKRSVVYGIGFGSSVALELAARSPSLVETLVLRDPPLPSDAERIDMASHYAPRIVLKPDGSHWYATWLMLRDSLVFWPWYNNSAIGGVRHVDLSDAFDADHMHDWTVEVMKQYASYHHVIDAALAQDTAALLPQPRMKVVLCTDPKHPFAIYRTALAASRPNSPLLELSGNEQADVARLFSSI